MSDAFPDTSESGTRRDPRRIEDDQVAIVCVSCEQPNPREHRYCRCCGSTLWKECPQCQTPRPMDEVFCANCGANMASAEQQRLDACQQQLQDVQTLVERGELYQAIRTLSTLARLDHPKLQEIRSTSEELLPKIKAQCDKHEQQATVHRGRARVLLEENRFREALTELNKIPAPFQGQEARELLDATNTRVKTIDRLRQRLLQPKGISFSDRMTAIRQLLEVDSHNPQVQRWASQIGDYVIREARDHIRSHRYDKASELSRSLPDSLKTEELRRLARHARELEYLESVLALAPTVDKVTLKAAERLIRLDKSNHQARAALEQLRERRGAASAAHNGVEWVSCPSRTHIGPPVSNSSVPRRMQFASPEVEIRFRKSPGRFYVACGLALQAIDRSAVSLNLIPPAKRRVRGLLRAGRRDRPANSGWGLDLSNSGLKAIQLTTDDTDQVRISECYHFEHSRDLGYVAADSRNAVLLESLRDFTQQHVVVPTERLAVQWPGIQSLVRWVTVPHVDGRKWKEMVRREVQHQIPFPLPDVFWDTSLLADANENGKSKQLILLAAKLTDCSERVELIQQCGLSAQIMQCDAVALHNFMHFEMLQGTGDSDGARPDAHQGIAAIDVGSDATEIVFSFPHFVWFRACRPADDDLRTAISQRFKVTREVAEQVKRDPTKVKRMSELYDEASIVFDKLVGQFGSVERDLTNKVPNGVIRQVLVTGGGSQTPGLLQYLRYGR